MLITRESAEPLAGLLSARGLMPVHVPLLRLAPTGDSPPSVRPDVAFVTSPTAARLEPRLPAVLAGVPVVALGDKTARALRAVGVEVIATGPGGGAETVDLVEQVLVDRRAGEHAVVWHVGAREVSEALERALSAWRRPVTRWTVYDNQVPEDAGSTLQAALPVGVLTFASGSASVAYAALASPGEARIVVIGQPTADAARGAGLRVDRIADRPSMESLADAALALSRPSAG